MQQRNFLVEVHSRQQLHRSVAGRRRWICHPRVTHNLMRQQVRDGGTFKVTRISDEFTYEQFIERNGMNCILFFTVDTNDNLNINTTENPLKVKAGDTIVAFVPGSELGFDPNVIEEH